MLAFDTNFEPVKPLIFNPVDLRKAQGLPYEKSNYPGFVNYTFSGSRLIETVFEIFPPARESFCNQTELEPGDLLVMENGTCGETGYGSYSQAFFTTTHEKNGAVEAVGGLNGALAYSGFTNNSEGTGVTFGEDVAYFSTTFRIGGGEVGFTNTLTFTNEEKTRAALTVDSWNKAFDTAYLIGTRRGDYTKITEEEFLDGLQQEWDANQVPTSIRTSLPGTKSCLGSICATEDDWCKHDPKCSVSPYQEPDGELKGSIIGGIAAVCAIVLFLIFYVYHRKRVVNEAKRVRQNVAMRIAEQVKMNFNSEELSQEALIKEFQNIDSSGDGVLQKDEVKEFFMSDKVGSITEVGFNAIFAALDNDGNGEVDFVEFVSFLGRCAKEFEERGWSDDEPAQA